MFHQTLLFWRVSECWYSGLLLDKPLEWCLPDQKYSEEFWSNVHNFFSFLKFSRNVFNLDFVSGFIPFSFLFPNPFSAFLLLLLIDGSLPYLEVGVVLKSDPLLTCHYTFDFTQLLYYYHSPCFLLMDEAGKFLLSRTLSFTSATSCNGCSLGFEMPMARVDPVLARVVVISSCWSSFEIWRGRFLSNTLIERFFPNIPDGRLCVSNWTYIFWIWLFQRESSSFNLFISKWASHMSLGCLSFVTLLALTSFYETLCCELSILMEYWSCS